MHASGLPVRMGVVTGEIHESCNLEEGGDPLLDHAKGEILNVALNAITICWLIQSF